MYRNKTARQHNFAVIPSAEIPRSKFRMRQNRKQAFDASELVPIMCEEILPGDTWTHRENIAARLATPIAPLIDDMDLETFYFFVPNRIVDENFEDLITGANTALTVPKIRAVNTGVANQVILGGVFDHFGLLPQTYTTLPLDVTAYPFWGYFKIWNEWFRDQNLQDEWIIPDPWVGNSDTITQDSVPWNQECLRINKRHDYFTSSLPWPQKGTPVTIGLTGNAPVIPTTTGANPGRPFLQSATDPTDRALMIQTGGVNAAWSGAAHSGTEAMDWAITGLEADLAAVTAVTINNIRLASLTQQLLERDARGGSRYVEQTLSHFKVQTPDYRLQRPEYLGGSKIPITINPIAQTAAYDAEPADAASPVGNLGAEMHASSSKRSFTYAATEHGYIIGLAAVRSTPTYQQGTRRHWRRETRLDFYFPTFAHLGEQAVDTEEIFQAGAAPANATWGYQERHAEYRYTPNEITGVLRSTAAQPLDWWHLSEEFVGEPALNAEFITDKTQETLTRSLATIGSAQWSAQIIMDIQHDSQVARLMPAYSVPGIDKF